MEILKKLFHIWSSNSSLNFLENFWTPDSIVRWYDFIPTWYWFTPKWHRFVPNSMNLCLFKLAYTVIGHNSNSSLGGVELTWSGDWVGLEWRWSWELNWSFTTSQVSIKPWFCSCWLVIDETLFIGSVLLSLSFVVCHLRMCLQFG